MRKIICFSVCLLSFAARGQHVVLSCDLVNVFYEDVDNPISAVVEGLGINNVIVETDNGSIEKDLKGVLVIHHLKQGQANLTIKKKQGNKTVIVGKKQVPVRPMTLPIVYLAGSNGYEISKAQLIHQNGLSCQLEGFDYTPEFKITRFEVTIIRNGEFKFNGATNSNLFSAEIKTAFLSLQLNDEVLFSKIYYAWPGKAERQLDDLALFINK